VLNRCVTTYVQVRAVKGSAVGAWSAAKGLRFTNHRPAPPTLGGVGLDNAVRFTWGYNTNATRYRVRWNAAPFGKFAGGDAVIGGWTNQYARSASLNLPTTPRAGDKMMGVAYANPVYGQIDANDICVPTAIPHSPYVPVFPKAPVPGPGDNLRMGTYNTELFPNNTDSPGRINGLAKNITDHDLTVVALQEANAATASSLKSKLDAKWRVAPSQTNSGQQILYDGTVFRAGASGVFNLPNPKPDSNPLPTPWVVLHQINPSMGASSQDLFVVSIHFAEDSSKTQMEKKHDANIDANSALRSIAAANTDDLPEIVAGDFRYLREPFNDVAGYVEAPPTFVRAGYYDAMAAVSKTNYQYTTVNGHQTQVKAQAGVASRADYIMLKGFEGSRAYVNVANWRYNGVFVSDHNLVYADVTIPYK
jgi:exonuclease III